MPFAIYYQRLTLVRHNIVVNEPQVREFILSELVLVDRGAIGVLYETALKFVAIGVGGILYTAGKKGGARGAELLRQQFGYEGEELLDAALVAFNRSNRGVATLQCNNGSLALKVGNSVLASSVERQRKPICHPIAGYIAGFLEFEVE